MPKAYSQKPIVIAHRGASGYLPEHTLLAVTAAHIMGADYIEQDIVLSSDGIPMVMHDIYLDTTTDVATQFPRRARADGRYYAIDFSASELKQLSVTERSGSNDTPVYPGRFPIIPLGMEIPTLKEEINLINGLNKSRGTDTGFYIELKAPRFHRDAGFDIAQAVITVLQADNLHCEHANVYLQCFDDKTLQYLRETLETPLPLIMLIAENSWQENSDVDYDWLRTHEGLDYIAQFADGIGPWLPQLYKADTITPSDLVVEAKGRGLKVHPYTIRADDLALGVHTVDELHTRMFIDLGVDGVFSDFPDKTRFFIDNHFGI